MFSKKIFAHENMKKLASKVAKPAQIQPKNFNSCSIKNLPPRDFSIMTLPGDCVVVSQKVSRWCKNTLVFGNFKL